jgi:hypothetical protein
MITNPELVRKAEAEYIRKNKMTIVEKYQLLDEMIQYANSIPRVIPEDPLGNLKAIIELARKLHSVPQVNIKDSR